MHTIYLDKAVNKWSDQQIIVKLALFNAAKNIYMYHVYGIFYVRINAYNAYFIHILNSLFWIFQVSDVYESVHSV